MITCTRDEAIKTLIIQDMDDQFYIQGILLDGFKGYENCSNSELEELINQDASDDNKITIVN